MSLKTLCQDMAANPNILTFSELGQAAMRGAILGKKVHQPLIGAVLGVSLLAGDRAVSMTKGLIAELQLDPNQLQRYQKKPRPK